MHSPLSAEYTLTPEESGGRPQAGFWSQLTALVESQPAAPAWRSTQERFAPLAEYLQSVLAEVGHALAECPDEDEVVAGPPDTGAWRTGLSLDRAQDIERRVLPELVYALRKAAADGDPLHIVSAIESLLLYLVRDHLREGQLPVLVALGRRPRVN